MTGDDGAKRLEVDLHGPDQAVDSLADEDGHPESEHGSSRSADER